MQSVQQTVTKNSFHQNVLQLFVTFFTSMSSILLYKHSNNNVSPPGICTCILKVLCTIAQSNKSARKLSSCILFHDRMICTYDVIMMRLRLGISSQMTTSSLSWSLRALQLNCVDLSLGECSTKTTDVLCQGGFHTITLAVKLEPFHMWPLQLHEADLYSQ